MGEWGCQGEGNEQLLTGSQLVVGVRLGVSAKMVGLSIRKRSRVGGRCLTGWNLDFMEDCLLFLFLISGSSLLL